MRRPSTKIQPHFRLVSEGSPETQDWHRARTFSVGSWAAQLKEMNHEVNRKNVDVPKRARL